MDLFDRSCLGSPTRKFTVSHLVSLHSDARTCCVTYGVLTPLLGDALGGPTRRTHDSTDGTKRTPLAGFTTVGGASRAMTHAFLPHISRTSVATAPTPLCFAYRYRYGLGRVPPSPFACSPLNPARIRGDLGTEGAADADAALRFCKCCARGTASDAITPGPKYFGVPRAIAPTGSYGTPTSLAHQLLCFDSTRPLDALDVLLFISAVHRFFSSSSLFLIVSRCSFPASTPFAPLVSYLPCFRYFPLIVPVR